MTHAVLTAEDAQRHASVFAPTMIFSDNVPLVCAHKALAYWYERQELILFVSQGGSCAVVADQHAYTFARYGWEQCCPEELERMLANV